MIIVISKSSFVTFFFQTKNEVLKTRLPFLKVVHSFSQLNYCSDKEKMAPRTIFDAEIFNVKPCANFEAPK